jgi:hypothetical protein
VRVGLDDPADDTPYWIVGTRQPNELAAALTQGVAWPGDDPAGQLVPVTRRRDVSFCLQRGRAGGTAERRRGGTAMAAMGSKLVGIASGIVVRKLSMKVLDKVWLKTKHTSPPEDPNSPHTRGPRP